MQAKFILATAVLATGFAGAALADTEREYQQDFTSTKTRAEVNAELAAYKQAGVNPWSRQYNPLKYFKSTASRDAVSAEYVAAREQVRAFTGEDSGSVWLAQHRLPGNANTNLAGTPANPQ